MGIILAEGPPLLMTYRAGNNNKFKEDGRLYNNNSKKEEIFRSKTLKEIKNVGIETDTYLSGLTFW